ncbi:MAG: hypothetical protein II642_01725, partial [Firmicutes bacterium]|nr:hypothetical protein [Bacillota bacterium]
VGAKVSMELTESKVKSACERITFCGADKLPQTINEMKENALQTRFTQLDLFLTMSYNMNMFINTQK